MSKRILVTLPDDVHAKFLHWCERLALSQSQLGGMAVQAGLDSILRAVSPMDSISPDQLAQVVQSMQKLGMEVSPEVTGLAKSAAKKTVAKRVPVKAAKKSTRKPVAVRSSKVGLA